MDWWGPKSIRNARFRRCVQGGRIDPVMYDCMITASAFVPVGFVGSLIWRASAVSLSHDVFVAAGVGCLTPILKRVFPRSADLGRSAKVRARAAASP
jgi:hypothetical protein